MFVKCKYHKIKSLNEKFMQKIYVVSEEGIGSTWNIEPFKTVTVGCDSFSVTLSWSEIWLNSSVTGI